MGGQDKFKVSTKQIHNRIKLLAGFDLGTLSTIGTTCGLDRTNIQLQRIMGLFSKS
jgi:hypothetical protein